MVDDEVVERALGTWGVLPADMTARSRKLMRAAIEEAVKAERERIADYLEGKGGKIPGLSCFARLVHRNNQPCMSGDSRDRLNRLDRRAFDETMESLCAAIRARGEKGGE